ncbi:MAG: hypothetical protein JOZ74_02030 [Bradyrhizobium sp.]|nr:hypothetical protein [Bradyrhizobium sp.]
MTLLDLRRDDIASFARENGAFIPRLFRRIGLSFRLLHRAILRATLRRLDAEWLFRRHPGDMMPLEDDATRFPQQPLVLGEKWDF